MVDITKNYHKKVCTSDEECIEFSNEKYQRSYISLKFAVFAGISFHDYSHENEWYYYSDNSVSPTIGAQLSLYSLRHSNSFSLQFETSLSRLVAKRENISVPENEYFEYYLKNNKKQAMLWNINIGPKYTYSKGNFRPTIEVGVGLTFLLGVSNKILDDGAAKPDGVNPFKEKTTQTCLIIHGGIGFDYKVRNANYLLFRLSYDWAAESFNSYNNKDKTNSFSCKLGYAF